MRCSFPVKNGLVFRVEERDDEGAQGSRHIRARLCRGRKTLATITGLIFFSYCHPEDHCADADSHSSMVANFYSEFFITAKGKLRDPDSDFVFFDHLESEEPIAGIRLYAETLDYLRRHYYEYDGGAVAYHRLDSSKDKAYEERLKRYYQVLGFETKKRVYQRIKIDSDSYSKWLSS